MNQNETIPEVERPVNESAVSIYGSNDAMDDFPVLKAFQQYIDAEQAKARKRMVMLCSFFGVVMICVIAVFVVLLLVVNSRNQALSDRLVDYAMRKLDSQPAAVQPPVVAVTPAGQDNSAIVALSEKLAELQRKLAEQSQGARSSATGQVPEDADGKTAAAKGQASAEQLEIKRLNALLAAEKEKQAVERERQRLAELEDYRRKHYPELYEKKTVTPKLPHQPVQRVSSKPAKPSENAVLSDEDQEDLLKEVAQILQESDAKAEKENPTAEKENSIPVDVQGSSSEWSIPND